MRLQIGLSSTPFRLKKGSRVMRALNCIKCGRPLDPGAKFCSVCGASTTVGDKTLQDRYEMYDGALHKCPSCGARLNAFDTSCPECGYELRDAHASASLSELSARLQEIQSSSTRNAPAAFISNLVRRFSGAEDESAALIAAFPIPNTKEDLIEFIIASASNVNPDAFNGLKQDALSSPERAVSRAWLTKLEQAYQKASITLGDDGDFIAVKPLYSQTMRKVAWAKRAELVMFLGIGRFIIIMILIIFIMSIFST